MTPRAHQLRLSFLVVLLLFVGGMLTIATYTLWRLRTDAITNGLEMAALHSRSFEDLLTQSLHVTELVAANTLAQSADSSDPRRIASIFVATLGRAPFLRSMSLIDERGRIVASSNPENLGIAVSTESFLPQLPPQSVRRDVLRIGAPWVGRDFAKGWLSTLRTSTDAGAPGFIPVTQTLTSGDSTLTLLVALNPDYFVNHMAQKLDASAGKVEILRYDGTLLMSTDPNERPGALHNYVVSDLGLPEIEFGSFEQDFGNERNVLTAFRASRLYPIVVVTHINREFALLHWRTEANALLSIVIPVLLAIVMLSFAFYRRQMQLSSQRAESLRLQKINATVFESSTVAILVTDLSEKIVSINPAYTRVTGYRPDEVIGRHLFELLTEEGIDTFTEAFLQPQPAAPGETQRAPTTIELQQRCLDGTLIWIEVNSTPERDANGAILGYHRICRNITERKRMQDQVRQLAFYDPLTKLPNRRLLDDRLDQTLSASKRSARYAALMFLDLDNFKPLNDTYGHGVGDLLLIQVADRLKACVRAMDTVARFGGDEFVVILGALSADKTESNAQARTIAEKISAALSAPYQLTITRDGETASTVEHHCSASIGVVVFINQDVSRQDILKWADRAMYQAKDAGRNAIRFHDPIPRADPA